MIHIISAAGGLYDWAVLCYLVESSLDSYCVVLFMEADTRGHSGKSGEEWTDAWFKHHLFHLCQSGDCSGSM